MTVSTSAAGFHLEHTKEELIAKAKKLGIPEHMLDGLASYIVDHRPTGHFLTAVLSNDLIEACNRVDTENRHLLYEYVFFMYNYAPTQCWGSPAKVQRWLEVGAVAREEQRRRRQQGGSNDEPIV